MMDLDKGKYYGLNEVATLVWQNLDEPASVNELCDLMLQKFDTDRPRCEKEIIEFLASLEQAELITRV